MPMNDIVTLVAQRMHAFPEGFPEVVILVWKFNMQKRLHDDIEISHIPDFVKDNSRRVFIYPGENRK